MLAGGLVSRAFPTYSTTSPYSITQENGTWDYPASQPASQRKEKKPISKTCPSFPLFPSLPNILKILRERCTLEKTTNAGVKGPLELRVIGVAFIQIKFAFSFYANCVLNHLFQNNLAVLLVPVIDHLGCISRVVHHMAGNINELDPLFFRGRIPTGKKAFIERRDNLVERVFFVLTVMATRVWVWGFKPCFVRLQIDLLMNPDPLQPVGRQVYTVKQCIELILIRVFDP